ncbi:serine hydrolase domain-containing protein [Thermomonas sp.]|uniref:serine hydrolase domain-containing protein n=1 Tax=Thermomonas sp. TaxID=1971895 RepID=UPI0039E5F257
MHFKQTLAATVVMFAIAAFGNTQAAEPAQTRATDTNATLDAAIEQHMQAGGLVGVGAAIIVNGKIAWTGGYGDADKQHGIAFTPDTIMNIGSISKTFTGVALMRAVQEGKLSLDRDINAYLPFKVINPHCPDAPITLRQLATHTSGIVDRPAVSETVYHFGDDAPEPLGEFLKSYLVGSGKHYARENFLDAKPGTRREYSNIGAGLAGYIVELVVGEKLNTYTRRHIFNPLQMRNSGWFLSEIPPGKHARLYVAHGLRIPIPLYEITTYPEGGVRTSVSDLARFFAALLNDGAYEGARILDKKSVDEMLRFQYTDANKPENVNLQGEDSVNSGIFWATKFDVTRIGHNGSDPGVRTMMLADPGKQIGVILFTNTSMADEESGSYFDIFDALWAHAVQMKHQADATVSQ